MSAPRSGNQIALMILSVLAFLGSLVELAIGLGSHFAQSTMAGFIGADLAATMDKIWIFVTIEGLLLFFMGVMGLTASKNARKALPALILSILYLAFVIFLEIHQGNDIIGMITSGNINLSLIGSIVFALLYDGFAYAVHSQGKQH